MWKLCKLECLKCGKLFGTKQKVQVNTKPRRDEEREVKMLGENRLAPSHSACSRRIPHECLTILYPVSENVQDEKISVDTLCQNTWQPD